MCKCHFFWKSECSIFYHRNFSLKKNSSHDANIWASFHFRRIEYHSHYITVSTPLPRISHNYTHTHREVLCIKQFLFYIRKYLFLVILASHKIHMYYVIGLDLKIWIASNLITLQTIIPYLPDWTCIVFTTGGEHLGTGQVQLATLPQHIVCLWYASSLFFFNWNQGIK